jgi:hypothetical protein
MDIGLTQLNVANARSCLNAGTYGTMGVGLGQAIAAAVAEPNRPVIQLSGDSAIGFSSMETLVRYNFPVKIVVLNNGGIGPGMPEIPANPVFDMKPNAPIYGARYDRMMEAFGGKGFLVEDPKDLKGAVEEAMNFRGPALVNVVISQGSVRKLQQFRWHSCPRCLPPRARGRVRLDKRPLRKERPFFYVLASSKRGHLDPPGHDVSAGRGRPTGIRGSVISLTHKRSKLCHIKDY